MNDESEILIERYLKKIKKSLKGHPKKEIEDRIKTIKAHICDAIQDQKENLSELEIIKNTIEDLEVPYIKILTKDKLISFSVSIFVLSVLLLSNLFETLPILLNSSKIPLFLIAIESIMLCLIIVDLFLTFLILSFPNKTKRFRILTFIQISITLTIALIFTIIIGTLKIMGIN